MFGLKLNSFCNFHPLEVVGRGSETQLQAGEIQTIYLSICAACHLVIHDAPPSE